MKLKEFQHYLKNNHIDLVFLRHPDINITYFTQENFSFSYLLITPKTANLYTTPLDKTPKIPSIKTKLINKHFEQELNQFHPKIIGLNKELLPISSLEKLQKNFPKTQFVNISEKLQELRSTKTPQEINLISQACHLTSLAFHSLIQELPRKTLKTEQDVALYLENYLRQNGAEIAFPTIVAMGKNAAIPHHITSNQPLHQGFLLLDFGASYHGYCADMSRTIYLGQPSNAEQKMYHLLLKTQREIISKIKLNQSYQELNHLCHKKLGKFHKYFTHSLGHGLGLEVHEAPSYTKETKIKSHQIFTIEPGLYFPNKFGLRIEDTLTINSKVNLLTTAPKELLCIPLKF